jgi:hypothetical protein
MALINSAQLIHEATNLGNRAYQVQQDPAVQKAWRSAGDDAVKTVHSVAAAVFETRAAWYRTSAIRGATFTGVRA